MGLEIERKFLLKNDKWRKKVKQEIQIKQGYLNSNKKRTVRIRIADNTGFITVKGKTKQATRKEFEYEIPIEDAKELLKLCKKPIVEKTRYLIEYKKKTWEIDEFYGVNQGLVVAEIELEDENEEISIPKWIGKEVTLDARYYNSSLIENPFSKWG